MGKRVGGRVTIEGDAAAVGMSRFAGQSERELGRVLGRFAVQTRSAVFVPCAILGLAAAPTESRTATAWVVGLALAWCVIRLYWLRMPPPGALVAAVQALVVVTVGLSQWWIGPQSIDSWVFELASITTVTSQFEWCGRAWLAASLSALTIGSYLAGNRLAMSSGDISVVAPVLRMVVETVLAGASYQLIRSWARTADAGEARAAKLRRYAAVAAARRAGEREYLATLHDTASATLLMVATGVRDRPGWLPERARLDLEVLGKAPEPGVGRADLATLLQPVVTDSATRVEENIEGPLMLPSEVAIGILHGVREAVANVGRHAGVGEATLSARRDDLGRIVVEVRDCGRGFRPETVSAHRRGIAGSIIGRMAAVDGRATVSSRPGEGTTVRWVWPDD